ncbi:MAG: hypothetical protein NC218_00460 [Acetobacter sp.]|nr:hypothetical protein [Acetobacter sp.]
MNIFKKLLRLFSQKDERCEEKSEGVARVLLEMPYNIVHPADLMESLLMAMAYQTKEPVCSSVKDIKLFSLYDRENGAFLGSFYALERNGLFYGNIVGSSQIFSCTTKMFRMDETDKLFAPLKNVDDKILVLMCEYNRRKSMLTAVCLKKMDEFMQNEEILHKFEKGTSFDEAYSFYQKTI